MIRVRLSGLDGLAFLLLGFLDALWISAILGWRELLLQSFLPARHGLKRTFGQGPEAIQPWINHGLEKQFLKFRVCETSSVWLRSPVPVTAWMHIQRPLWHVGSPRGGQRWGIWAIEEKALGACSVPWLARRPLTTYTYTYTHIHIHIHIYIYTYTYIHIHLHKHKHNIYVYVYVTYTHCWLAQGQAELSRLPLQVLSVAGFICHNLQDETVLRHENMPKSPWVSILNNTKPISWLGWFGGGTHKSVVYHHFSDYSSTPIFKHTQIYCNNCKTLKNQNIAGKDLSTSQSTHQIGNSWIS